jgi:uncharacterized protein YndB with AHSA1/START domain
VSVLRSDRRFTVPVGPDELWAALTSVEDYLSWWPWLRSFEHEPFETGARWRCVVRPPLGYRVCFDIELTDVAPASHVSAVVDGEIVGTADLDVATHPVGSELRLRSELAPVAPLLRWGTALVPSLARLGHDQVIDAGARQFRDRAVGR